LLAALVAAAPVVAVDTDTGKGPGFVDGSRFLELATEDTGVVEVNLHGGILKAITAFDPDLKKLAGGLESIHAVILSFEKRTSASRALEVMRQTERRLVDRKWDVLTKIKNGDSNVTVLVLGEEETIRGLVVLAADAGGEEVVFANIAGIIDLAAIAKLGETLEIPGLDQIDP
jgi:hypothetical protein